MNPQIEIACLNRLEDKVNSLSFLSFDDTFEGLDAEITLGEGWRNDFEGTVMMPMIG